MLQITKTEYSPQIQRMLKSGMLVPVHTGNAHANTFLIKHVDYRGWSDLNGTLYITGDNVYASVHDKHIRGTLPELQAVLETVVRILQGLYTEEED